MDQTNPPEGGGDSGRAGSDPSGNPPSGTGGSAGGSGVDSTPPLESHQGDAGAQGGGEGASGGTGAGGEDAAGADQQSPGKHGYSPSTKGGRTYNSAYDITRALTQSKGDRALAARILGITGAQLALRINSHQQLKALWSKPNDTADGPSVPREGEVLNRELPDLPDDPPGAVELAQLVSDQDNEILRHGLKKLGVKDETLQRLRDLDGLARTSGHFLSVSLEKTHRMYFLQLVHLMEVGDDLRKKLLAQPGEQGYIVDDETRAYFNKNYAEIVKESGRGYSLMMEGAQAMVRMMQAASSDKAPEGGLSKKPKWGRVKRAEEQAAADAKD